MKTLGKLQRPCRSHQLVVLAFCALLCSTGCNAQVYSGLGKYDPCTTPALATLYQGFYVGAAFWPGHAPEEWGPYYNSTSGQFGLNPCNFTVPTGGNESDRQLLANAGVVFASYELKVDTMTSMRFSATDISQLYNLSTTNPVNQTALPNPGVVSMVVFRAGFRSEARVIISNETVASGGTGFVNTLAFAVTFANGVLSAFTWDNVGCNQCGGTLGANCLQTNPEWSQPQQSCALPLTDCTVNQNCTLNVITGYTGSDQHGNTFTTATMIDQVNKYSAATLYNGLAAGLSNVLAGSGQQQLGGSTPVQQNTAGTVA
ncbi:hypothetical protein WJX73_002880 [Symbiochloris irregularis]|uniref:Uncharacterized protein n=1 Tax=Symbiochloris irregularis TaxID=706552 RepID=A0AAW1NVQ6_9CHLO